MCKEAVPTHIPRSVTAKLEKFTMDVGMNERMSFKMAAIFQDR